MFKGSLEYHELSKKQRAKLWTVIDPKELGIEYDPKVSTPFIVRSNSTGEISDLSNIGACAKSED